MSGYKFDYEKKVWGGEKLRLSPVHFRASRLYYALIELKGVRGKILDVGCGVGDFSEAIEFYRPDLDVYAVDISSKAIALAKKRNLKVHFKVCDAQKLPFKSNFFDAIVCFDLIEHVKSPKRVLDEIYRVLKPKGILHTFIPMEDNIFSMEGMLIRLGWKAKEIYGGHPHHFSYSWIRNTVNESGFEIRISRWGEHLVNQILEIIYFTWLSIRQKNVRYSVEGYFALTNPRLLIRCIKFVKNILATLSYLETRLFYWLPGLGLHLTCIKQ